MKLLFCLACITLQWALDSETVKPRAEDLNGSRQCEKSGTPQYPQPIDLSRVSWLS